MYNILAVESFQSRYEVYLKEQFSIVGGICTLGGTLFLPSSCNLAKLTCL